LRERVFDRFFREPYQLQSGSGLGLAIVKAVAQQRKPDYFRRRCPDGNG